MKVAFFWEDSQENSGRSKVPDKVRYYDKAPGHLAIAGRVMWLADHNPRGAWYWLAHQFSHEGRAHTQQEAMDAVDAYLRREGWTLQPAPVSPAKAIAAWDAWLADRDSPETPR